MPTFMSVWLSVFERLECKERNVSLKDIQAVTETQDEVDGAEQAKGPLVLGNVRINPFSKLRLGVEFNLNTTRLKRVESPFLSFSDL